MVRVLKFSDAWLLKKGWSFEFLDVDGVFLHEGELGLDEDRYIIYFDGIKHCRDIGYKFMCETVSVVIHLDKSEIPIEFLKDAKYAEDVFVLPWESWEIYEKEGA